MRRALEEADPRVETYSAAGYFGRRRGLQGNRRSARCGVLPRSGQTRARRRWNSRNLKTARCLKAAVGAGEFWDC